jgi:glutamate racemase
MVGLAEEGEHGGEFCDTVLRHYLHGFVEEASIAAPATVLLGCTHFPVFREALGRMLSGRDIRIVDSAETTATVVSAALSVRENGPGSVHFLATDGIERFRRVGRHFLGRPIDAVELVDL